MEKMITSLILFKCIKWMEIQIGRSSGKKGEICLNLMRSFMFDDDHEDLQGWISQLLLFLFKRRNSEIDNSKNTKIHNCRQALASIHFF